MTPPKKTIEEKVDAVLDLFGQVSDDVSVLKGEVEKAGKAAGAAIGLAQKAAGTLKVHIEQCSPEAEEDEPEKAPMCFLNEEDPIVIETNLRELAHWLRTVYVRYPDHGLPSCWAWHPWAVTELWHLFQAWKAYYSPKGSDIGVLDWHVRYRKPVADQIRQALAECELKKHVNQRTYIPTMPVMVPAVEEALLGWYAAEDFGQYAPPPPDPNEVGLEEQRMKRERDLLDGGATRSSVPKR